MPTSLVPVDYDPFNGGTGSFSLVPVDHDPFADSMTMGVDPSSNNPIAKVVGGALQNLATLPQRAIQNSQFSLDTGNYDPSVPVETALTMMGGSGAVPAEANSLRMGIKAYHGSPHDFDAFDLSKIGTGEGAQAYGRGLYFADKEGVARSYRDALAGSTVDGQEFNPANPLHQAAALVDETGNRAAALDEIDKRIASDPGDDMHPRARAMLLHRPEIPPIKAASGKMYEVNINADPEQFLDWDKPLSEQSPQAQAALKQSMGANWDQFKSAKAGDAVRQGFIAPGEDTTAATLNQAGIPGIKYLDQGSRAAGDGSRNYVIFNDKLIDIVKKYAAAGIALPPAIAAQYAQNFKPVDHDPFTQ